MFSPDITRSMMPLNDSQCYETDFHLNLKSLRFLVAEIWLILYLTFIVNWGLGRIQKKKYVNGLRPQALIAFGFNSTSQLVIGYHWLTRTKPKP